MPRTYITKAGDRWDWISYQFYGTCDLYKEIIKANPQLPIEIIASPILPAGIELVIPDIEVHETVKELPPWKK
jgi:phage tail protein X